MQRGQVLMVSFAGRLGCLLLLLTLLAGGEAPAKVADACYYPNGGLNGSETWLEWLEGSQPRGARLVFDNRWRETTTLHSQWLAYEGAPADARVSGWMRRGLPPFTNLVNAEKLKSDLGIRDAGPLEAALHPGIVELSVSATTGMVPPASIFAVTPLQSVKAAGLDGFARVVGATAGDRVVYATAFAVEAGCYSLFGMVSADEGQRQLPVDDLGFLNLSIRVEWYELVPLPPPRPPLSPQGMSILEALRDAGSAPLGSSR
jgi:hypothetical protein